MNYDLFWGHFTKVALRIAAITQRTLHINIPCALR